MRPIQLLAAGLALMLTAACFHATIVTGAPPSTTVIKKSFASGWIYGLVPPSTVETASRCPAGVARVETVQSFANGLVRVLTLGIYSPMSIKVTCARAGSADAESDAQASVVQVDPDSPTGFEDALAAAIQKSIDENGPVLVQTF